MCSPLCCVAPPEGGQTQVGMIVCVSNACKVACRSVCQTSNINSYCAIYSTYRFEMFCVHLQHGRLEVNHCKHSAAKPPQPGGQRQDELRRGTALWLEGGAEEIFSELRTLKHDQQFFVCSTSAAHSMKRKSVVYMSADGMQVRITMNKHIYIHTYIQYIQYVPDRSCDERACRSAIHHPGKQTLEQQTTH